MNKYRITSTESEVFRGNTLVCLGRKKICFNLDIVQRGGGSNLNPNCSRHLFSALIWTFSKGGGGVDSSPKTFEALFRLRLDIMKEKNSALFPAIKKFLVGVQEGSRRF